MLEDRYDLGLELMEVASDRRKRPLLPNAMIDLEDAAALLGFAHDYLASHSRAPTADELHDVTAAIARFKGPSPVGRKVLESFVDGLSALHRHD